MESRKTKFMKLAHASKSNIFTNYNTPVRSSKTSIFRNFLPAVCAQELASVEGKLEEPVKATPRVPVDEDVVNFIRNETGFDRLEQTFGNEFSELDGIKYTRSTVLTMAQVGCTVGFFLGWVIGVNKGAEEFTSKHKISKFATKFRAVRMRTDFVLMSGFRHGALWAAKTAGFVTMYIFIDECISVYRNKDSPVHQIVAGMTTCSILRSHLGVRGLISGSIFGAIIGSISGSMTYYVKTSFEEKTREQRHYDDVTEMIAHYNFLKQNQ